MSTPVQPRATFGVRKKLVPGVLIRAQTMYDGIATHAALFGSPTIAMVAFLALIAALVAAQQAVRGTNARGSATLRNTKRDALWTAMESLRAYVQGLADVLPAEGAASLIEAAGMVVGEVSGYRKALLTATLTTTPGVVHLDAYAALLVGPENARKKVVFNWQWTGDGGQSWNDVHATPHANTDVAGLARLGEYGFRVSVTIGKVTGAWSQPVSLLVH